MPDAETTTTWDGFSDYQSVSQRNAKAIHDAVQAFSQIERIHKEGDRPDYDDAALAGARIMTAAINVKTELAAYQDQNREYAELLEEFDGEDGYVERLRRVELATDCPDWLLDFVVDIRRAGFKLGYLKAGREDVERNEETPESEAKEMFTDL